VISDHGLALALAALASDAGCDIATLIHDLDETGACAADCSGCSLPDDPPRPNWCQWCGESGHVIESCADLAERRIRATCTCGCPSAWNGECMCGSLCPCDPCPYCDRNAGPEAPWLAEVVADDDAPTVETDKPSDPS
jgi:hypothetical protein